MSCLDCQEGLDHCHELLVVHIDGSVECPDPLCEGGVEAHEWMNACADLRFGCECTRTGHTQPLAA